MIALFSITVAATTAVLLYIKLTEKSATARAAGAQPSSVESPIVMSATPPAQPATLPNDVVGQPEADAAVADAPDAASPIAEPEPSTKTPATHGSDNKVATAPQKDARDRGLSGDTKVDTKGDKDPKVETKTATKTSPKTDTKGAAKPDSKVEAPSERVPPPLPAAPPGFITIDSTPVYAVIYIDGRKYGETPLVNIKVPPGKHAVRAVSPSGATKQLSIIIESGKTAPVRKISW